MVPVCVCLREMRWTVCSRSAYLTFTKCGSHWTSTASYKAREGERRMHVRSLDFYDILPYLALTILLQHPLRFMKARTSISRMPNWKAHVYLNFFFIRGQ